MLEITSSELRQKLASGNIPFLVDVREDFEHEHQNIGGILIPLGEVITRANEIPKDKEVIIYCRKGVRSHLVIQRLQEKFGFTNLVNLKGGLEAFNREGK